MTGNAETAPSPAANRSAGRRTHPRARRGGHPRPATGTARPTRTACALSAADERRTPPPATETLLDEDGWASEFAPARVRRSAHPGRPAAPARPTHGKGGPK
ncbi:hypothetical protein ACH40E_36390 [Streptomyces acidicola]|uniref:hypothetical protein n=1 Tax=Streptomyces acidicola TaxID=2596892 RepID=UPI0037A19684